MRLPQVGEVVHYINLGDKDGKYPPEVQAAVLTGRYQISPVPATREDYDPGNNDPDAQGLLTANALGAVSDSLFVDLKVLYRQGEFNMTCVPYSEEPKRGHWSRV